MKPKLIVAGIALAAFLSCGDPSAYARGGHGGGGGGFSGGHGSGGHAGAGGAAVSAGTGARAGFMGGYTGGGFSRARGGSVYGGNSFAVRTTVYRNSNSSLHPSNRHLQVSQSLHSQRAHTNRTISGANRIHRTDRSGSLNQGTRSADSNRSGNSGALTTRGGRSHPGKWARNNPANKNRFDQQTQNRLRNWPGKKSDFAEANRRHHGDHGGDRNGRHNGHHNGHHHDHDWWHHHCAAIILIGGGYWGWWDGWWYPAWGYDSSYSAYDYDGPIYAYGGLPPDEVVAQVQSELQRLGYYTYPVDGVLGAMTQNAISRYQRDHRLPMTGAIDPATVGALGLNYRIVDAQ